jgi:hypothetical protein
VRRRRPAWLTRIRIHRYDLALALSAAVCELKEDAELRDLKADPVEQSEQIHPPAAYRIDTNLFTQNH